MGDDIDPKAGAWQSAFRKRHRTLFTKAHTLKAQAPDNIRVYLLIERIDEGVLYHWNSDAGSGDWPPSLDGLVSKTNRDRVLQLIPDSRLGKPNP